MQNNNLKEIQKVITSNPTESALTDLNEKDQFLTNKSPIQSEKKSNSDIKNHQTFANSIDSDKHKIKIIKNNDELVTLENVPIHYLKIWGLEMPEYLDETHIVLFNQKKTIKLLDKNELLYIQVDNLEPILWSENNNFLLVKAEGLNIWVKRDEENKIEIHSTYILSDKIRISQRIDKKKDNDFGIWLDTNNDEFGDILLIDNFEDFIEDKGVRVKVTALGVYSIKYFIDNNNILIDIQL